VEEGGGFGKIIGILATPSEMTRYIKVMNV